MTILRVLDLHCRTVFAADPREIAAIEKKTNDVCTVILQNGHKYDAPMGAHELSDRWSRALQSDPSEAYCDAGCD